MKGIPAASIYSRFGVKAAYIAPTGIAVIIVGEFRLRSAQQGMVLALPNEQGILEPVAIEDLVYHVGRGTVITVSNRNLASMVDWVRYLHPGRTINLYKLYELFPCPCCGYYYDLNEQPPGTFEICGICGWEDDALQFREPDYRGGANGPSLNEARREFDESMAGKPYPELLRLDWDN